MSKYKVEEPRFFNDSLHGPGTGRNFITVDKPFPKDKIPSGLVLVTEGKKASAPETLDKSLIKKVMLEMIEKKEGCTPDGVPTMKPLKDRTKLKFNQDVRDEIMAEISQDNQNKIDVNEVTFTENPGSKVQAL